MNPFFFGESQRQLYGVYDEPEKGGTRGVVICSPWARESLLAHSSLRQLARRLSEERCHVLRFDYFGTGDSAGDLEEATPEVWLSNIGMAIDELKDLAQLERVSVVGMRYGAALAAEAVASRADIASLALWDPVFDGRSYLRELGAPPAASRGVDVAGVVLGAALRASIEHLTVASYRAGVPRTLLLNSSAPDAYGPLEDRLASLGVELTVVHEPDIPAWRAEWGRGGVGLPVKAIGRIVSWIA